MNCTKEKHLVIFLIQSFNKKYRNKYRGMIFNFIYTRAEMKEEN